MCRTDKRKSQAFPFESISRISAARSWPQVKSLFGSWRNDFLAMEEMNWMTKTDLVDLILRYLYFSSGSKNSFIAGPKIQVCWHFLTNQICIFTNLF